MREGKRRQERVRRTFYDRRAADPASSFPALRPLIAVWSVGIAVIGLAMAQQQAPSEDLFMDATHVGGQRWFIGMVAALGILAWTASVCFCLMTAWIAGLAGRPGAQSAFRGAGILFAVLLLDDLFLFHSDLLPRTFGVPKVVVLVVYAIAAAGWISTSAAEILRTRFQFLAAAALAFGVSLVVEILLPGSDSGSRGAVEDGSKFLGVLALALWSTSSTTDVIRSVITSRPDSEGLTSTRHNRLSNSPVRVDRSP